MSESSPAGDIPSSLTCDALVVMGVAGSGKSTVAAAVAQRLGWAHIDADDFHPEANIDKMRAGTPLTDDDRVPWLDKMRAELDRRTADAEPAVLSCSALKRRYREVLCGGSGVIGLVHLRVSREILAERLSDREGHFFPAALIDSQLAALEEPGQDEDALIVDATADGADIAEQVILRWGR